MAAALTGPGLNVSGLIVHRPIIKQPAGMQNHINYEEMVERRANIKQELLMLALFLAALGQLALGL